MRRKSNPLTNQVAKDALRKLEAVEIAHSGAHPKYAIYDARGNVLATTSLRHSSTRDIPVRHVKDDLKVSLPFVLDLARCPKDKDDWLKAIGAIPAE
jgi:hypothetical protein